MGLRTEADWLDVQILKTHAAGAHQQVLRLNRHELRVEPGTEHLAVEGLEPVHVLVVVCVLKGYRRHVRFDLADVKEHLIDFLVLVSVWASELVRLADSLLHLDAVHDGESNIVGEHRLDLAVHTLNLPHHSVEHLHVHAPFGSNRRIRVDSLDHIGGPDDGDIGADSLDFLFANPFRAETLAL